MNVDEFRADDPLHPVVSQRWVKFFSDVLDNFRNMGDLFKILSASATLDFPSVAAQGQQELTVSVVGAKTGSPVAVSPPAALESGLVVNGRVTADDVVTIRLLNITGVSIDPVSGSYRAVVFRY